jgi:hypothetical protein
VDKLALAGDKCKIDIHHINTDSLSLESL